MTKPFMEHPSGEYESAVEAIADAIKRLRSLPQWDDWITISAQGMGHRRDGYHVADMLMRQDEIKIEEPIDAEVVTRLAGVPQSCFSRTADGYSVAGATPIEAARIMDVIFRHYMGVRPHDDEGDDYAVGAEW